MGIHWTCTSASPCTREERRHRDGGGGGGEVTSNKVDIGTCVQVCVCVCRRTAGCHAIHTYSGTKAMGIHWTYTGHVHQHHHVPEKNGGTVMGGGGGGGVTSNKVDTGTCVQVCVCVCRTTYTGDHCPNGAAE